jgi:4'-phosphopantetheinyl transferase EntD
VVVHSTLPFALNALAYPGLAIGHRIISLGDEHLLMRQELPAFATSVPKVQRASGAARSAARGLLKEMGLPACALPRLSSGATDWPAGIVGSLAHDSLIAVAAIGQASSLAAVGIDVEPAESLPRELLNIVATPLERQRIDDDPYHGRLLFTIKEAVYKAAYSLDHIFLDHHEVEVRIPERTATTRYGRIVQFQFSFASHLIALAVIPAEGGMNSICN